MPVDPPTSDGPSSDRNGPASDRNAPNWAAPSWTAPSWTAPNPRRVGLLLPHTDTTLEWDLARLLPDHSIHAHRLFLRDVSIDAEIAMVEEETPSAVRYLTELEPEVTIFGCTSAGALYGIEGERRFSENLASDLGCPVVSAFGSVLAFLARHNVARLALFTPYTIDVHNKVATSVEESGTEIVWNAALGLRLDTDIGRVSPAELLERFRDVALPECDAVFLSCTNLRGSEAASELQQRFGVRVFSSNMAIVEAVAQVPRRPSPGSALL